MSNPKKSLPSKKEGSPGAKEVATKEKDDIVLPITEASDQLIENYTADNIYSVYKNMDCEDKYTNSAQKVFLASATSAAVSTTMIAAKTLLGSYQTFNENNDRVNDEQEDTVIQKHIEIAYIKSSTLPEIDESKKMFLLLLVGFHKNNNLINNSIKMVSYKYNDELNEYKIGLLFSNTIDIDKFFLLLQPTITTHITHELIETYTSKDPYEYWIYPNNASVNNQSWYNLPKKSYGDLIMSSDPFLGSEPYTNYTIGKIKEEQKIKLSSITNDPMYLLAKIWYILPEINNIPVQITRPHKRNVIALFFGSI